MTGGKRWGLVASRRVLTAQGVYYVGTGVAPLVSRRMFERITGPKLEWWLVQTVGLLVTAVGVGLLSAVRRRRETPDLVAVATGCAGGLAAIDVVYVARRRISPVYLVDACVQLALLAGSPLVAPAVTRIAEALRRAPMV